MEKHSNKKTVVALSIILTWYVYSNKTMAKIKFQKVKVDLWPYSLGCSY